MQALWLTLRHTVKLVGTQRKLWLPFLVTAFVEALFVGVVWLAPQPPFSTLLAPPLRYVYGDHALHYPWHLWFLYHTMKHTHLAASIVVGAFMSGVACAMVGQTHQGQRLSLREALVTRRVRYGTLLMVWVVTWSLATGLGEAVASFAPKTPQVFWISVGLTLLLQAFVVYAIPAAVFHGASWWRALGQSVRETLRYPFSTLLVVAVPSAGIMLFALGCSSQQVASWITRTEPEIAVAFIAARLMVWTLADALLTVTSAHLWWVHRAMPQAARAQPVAPAVTARANPAALVALCVAALLVSGCSASYTGERLLWKAQRVSAPIATAPNQATPEQVAKAIAAFETVVTKAPGTVWAARAQVAIGSLYALQEQFVKAREAYTLVLLNAHEHQALCLTARFAIAKTYQMEEDWDAAIKAYEQLADYHPWSHLGLEAPLYIARTYEQRKEADEAGRAYERAARRYTNLIPDAPTPQIAIQIKSFLILAYQRLGEWDHATETLEDLASTPEGVNRPLVLISLGSIYQTKLASPKNAQRAYSQLIREFPENPLANAAKTQLERLGLPMLPPVTR